MKKYSIFILFILGSCTLGHRQKELGHRSVQILKIDQREFKDLNKNHSLDIYEDWRQPIDKRIEDLISQMTLEEKVGYLLISTTRMEGDYSFQRELPKNPVPLGSGFNEADLSSPVNIFTFQPLEYPFLSASGTTKGVMDWHLRHFILRADPPAKMLAEWSNNLQALCESSRLGIPALIASNPRNHLTKDHAVGLSLGATTFSQWPGELGLSATGDLKLIREFGNIARQEWHAVGLRKGYQYMADLATEPRWQRIEGTFGEDAQWVSQVIREVILGFQGKKINENSVALTTKHFPGGGPQVEGQDPHFPWGKDQHYPGNNFQYHLKPFKAAIKAGTASMMPYYAKPINTEFEEVGFAYSKKILDSLLRKEMGFKGYINSDTGPIMMMPWGMEDQDIPHRYARAMDAGVDLFSGTADPTLLLKTVNEGLIPIERIDLALKRLFYEKFKMGLFENPYVNPEEAEKIVGNSDFQKKADLAQRKSIVLLKNEGQILPFKSKKIYAESYWIKDKNSNPHEVIHSNNYPGIEFVDSPELADEILLWLFPGNGGSFLFDSKGDPIELTLSKNSIDIAYLKKIQEFNKPIVFAVNFSSPWVLEEIQIPKGLIATFNVSNAALLDVVLGKFKPTGKLPITIPATRQQVLDNLSDIPGFMKPQGFALYLKGDGLTY